MNGKEMRLSGLELDSGAQYDMGLTSPSPRPMGDRDRILSDLRAVCAADPPALSVSPVVKPYLMRARSIHDNAEDFCAPVPSNLGPGAKMAGIEARLQEEQQMLSNTSLRGSAQEMLKATPKGTQTHSRQVNKKACQFHENDLAEVVIVCEPEGASVMMGGLHPRSSLFERPLNLAQARKQHENFREVMRTMGVKVLTVRDILRYAAEQNVRARVELEEFALGALQYKLKDGVDASELGSDLQWYLSDDYKREVLEQMSTDQLLDVIMTNPTVHLRPSGRDTGLNPEYTFAPLANLIYSRDQQITTAKGIVMGRLRSSQRQREVAIMRLCFLKLGMPVVGEIAAPGYLEGGDFFPAGPELCLIGVGLRSNMEACQQLMERDLLGTRCVAVVRDDFEKHQDRMHLDCVFSILSDDCCIMLEDMMGETSPTRRLVDEYVRDPISGKYTLARSNVEFSRYIRAKGFNIIPVSGADQLKYGCNILNLGQSTILSVHEKTARQITRSPHFKGDVFFVEFDAITSMYGAAHCSSQIVKRSASRWVNRAKHSMASGMSSGGSGAKTSAMTVPLGNGRATPTRDDGNVSTSAPLDFSSLTEAAGELQL